jgi:hypothetical protein
MTKIFLTSIGLFLALAAACIAEPIRLHSDNPHYFQ